MSATRLLLPFKQGVKILALEYAVLLAKSRDATLVPLSLIQVSNECGSKGARLEHIQQSKDFLAAVAHQAAKYAVPIEPIEIFTSDVVKSIGSHAQSSNCEGILLFVSEGDDILLPIGDVKHVLTRVSSMHHVIHLQSIKKQSRSGSLLKRLSRWMNKEDAEAETEPVSTRLQQA